MVWSWQLYSSRSVFCANIFRLYMGVSGNEEYPLVDCYITMENHHFSWENSLFRLGHVQYVSHYQRVPLTTQTGDGKSWDLVGGKIPVRDQAAAKNAPFPVIFPGMLQDFPRVWYIFLRKFGLSAVEVQEIVGSLGSLGPTKMSPWQKIHKQHVQHAYLTPKKIRNKYGPYRMTIATHRWFPLNQSFATWWTDGWRRSPHMQTSDPVTRLDVYQPCLLEDRLETAASVLLLLLQGGHVAGVWWAVHRIDCQISLYRDVYGLDYGGGHSL